MNILRRRRPAPRAARYTVVLDQQEIDILCTALRHLADCPGTQRIGGDVALRAWILDDRLSAVSLQRSQPER